MDKEFTRIPNDILDALIQYSISGAHMKVILYVLRKTYGWRKNRDRISITRMAKEIGVTKRWCIGIVGDLRKNGILEAEDGGNGRIYDMRICDPENWDKPVNETSPVNKNTPMNKTSPRGEQKFTGAVNKTSPEPVNKNSPTKETIKKYKETIQKERVSPPPEDISDDDDGMTPDELEQWLRERKENGTV